MKSASYWKVSGTGFKVCGLNMNKAAFTLFENNTHEWVEDGLPDGHFNLLFKEAKGSDTFWKQDVTVDVTDGFATKVYINGKQWGPSIQSLKQ